ncbi:hypothetical protein ACFYMW_00490 [Streptomyces sp. NPDC006692]|uniref:hypothetical protein n=1 Tax=unclassified Streptomyces TaxID=2593676 RepID=UPI00339FE1BA
MTMRRRSPHDLGEELWELIGAADGKAIVRDDALETMAEGQFEIAKAWAKDNKCVVDEECLLYLFSQYMRTRDPRLSVLAVTREVALIHKRAVRLQRSAIAPLAPADQESPQIIVINQAVGGIVRATRRLHDAGFSAELALRSESTDD